MTKHTSSRRTFIRNSGLSASGLILLGPSVLVKSKSFNPMEDSGLKISLAQWSLHNALFAKKIDNLDFAAKTREFGIDAMEYVNVFFETKAMDTSYLNEMNKRASDHGVTQLLIMVDREGNLAEKDEKARQTAIDNHKKWVDAAKYLGCHSIRVNARGEGTRMDQFAQAVDGLSRLAAFAQNVGINVIVENHGGLSSDGSWLSGVIKEVGMDNCGTLPDFGNFCIKGDPNGDCPEEYDRYKGVEELMPFAKAVSAKSNVFNEDGDETHIDYKRMIKIVSKAGYQGFIGIEYEGNRLSETEGIIATKKLLERYI